MRFFHVYIDGKEKKLKMKKVILLVLIGLTIMITEVCGIHAEASQTNLSDKCVGIKDFLLANLDEFKKQYNATYDDTLSVDGFEGYTLVYVIDKEKYAVYIDFNDDNGYILISLDLIIYKLENKGDLDYLKNVKFAYYSILDGFLYKKDGLYHSFVTPKETDKSVQYGYEGQTGSGDGYILNIDKYVSDRYSNYTLKNSYDYCATSIDYVPIVQSDVDFYRKYISKDNGNTYPFLQSEQSCALVAATNVMYSWRNTRIIPQLPDPTWPWVNIEAQRRAESFYSTYGTGTGGTGIESYWKSTSFTEVPEVYAVARAYAVAEKEYTPEHGLSANDAMETICHTISKYNLLIEPGLTPHFANVMIYLRNDRAVFLGISNSSSYGNHAVALLGYREYTYKTGWWIYEKEETAYFYIILDGYNNNVTYFDPNTPAYPSFEFVYN